MPLTIFNPKGDCSFKNRFLQVKSFSKGFSGQETGSMLFIGLKAANFSIFFDVIVRSKTIFFIEISTHYMLTENLFVMPVICLKGLSIKKPVIFKINKIC